MTDKTPSQVAAPGQAAKRTLAAALAAVVAAPIILLVVVDIINIILEGFGDSFSLEVSEAFVTMSTLFVSIAVALTRIMAIPAVNDFLTKIGLGAEAKEAIDKVEASVQSPPMDAVVEQGDNFSPSLEKLTDEELDALDGYDGSGDVG